MFIVLQVSLRKVVTHMVMLHVMVLFSVDTQISRNKLLKSEEFSLDEKRVRFYFTHLFCYQQSKGNETGATVIAALIEKRYEKGLYVGITGVWKYFIRLLLLCFKVFYGYVVT